MFARNVAMQLKPDAADEFGRVIEMEILPLLRKWDGFADELTLLDGDRNRVVAISLWDSEDNADAYSRDGYAEVLKRLAQVVEGTPVVRTYEVSNSTFHKIPGLALT